MISQNAKDTIAEIRKEKQESGVDVHARTQTPVGIDEVVETIKDLGETRGWIMKVILAVYVSTFLEKESPVWMMLVGNPSSNKTTLTDLLKKSADIFALDTMTANPFISGQKETKKDKAKDLLPLLDGKCFIIKEYGAFFGRSDEMVKQLLSDLTAIYDGEYLKHSPTRGTIQYKSTFSHIGCVTPQTLNNRQKYMNSVGARFLFMRIPTLTEEERNQCLTDFWDGKKRKSKSEIAELVAQFCETMRNKIKEGVDITFSKKSQKILNNYANLIARTRGIVITEASTFKTSEGKKQTHYEVVDTQIEEPFRALKQIQKLSRSLSIVSNRNSVGEEELEIVRKIVLSSMPTRRADILKVFERGQTFTAKSASDSLKKNYKTVKRNFDEMVALGVLENSHGENQQAHEYSLKPEFCPCLSIDFSESESEIVTSEYVEKSFSEEELNSLPF